MSPKSLMGSAAFAAALISLPAVAQSSPEQPAFPEQCVKFNDAAKVGKNPYDNALAKLAEELKAVPGWDQYQKNTGEFVKGICAFAYPTEPGKPHQRIELDANTGSMDVNIMEPDPLYGFHIKTPEEVIRDIPFYVQSIADKYNIMAMDSPALQPLRQPSYDADSLYIMTAVVAANLVADQALIAVDYAVMKGDDRVLEEVYTKQANRFGKVIGDLQSKATDLKAAGKFLSNEDRTAFRTKMIEALLMNTDNRKSFMANIAEGLNTMQGGLEQVIASGDPMHKMMFLMQAGDVKNGMTESISEQEIAKIAGSRVRDNVDISSIARSSRDAWLKQDPAQAEIAAIKESLQKISEGIEALTKELSDAAKQEQAPSGDAVPFTSPKKKTLDALTI